MGMMATGIWMPIRYGSSFLQATLAQIELCCFEAHMLAFDLQAILNPCKDSLVTTICIILTQLCS